MKKLRICRSYTWIYTFLWSFLHQPYVSMWKARKNYEYDMISIDFDDKVDDLKIIKSNISNLLFLIYLKKLKTLNLVILMLLDKK